MLVPKIIKRVHPYKIGAIIIGNARAMAVHVIKVKTLQVNSDFGT